MSKRHCERCSAPPPLIEGGPFDGSRGAGFAAENGIPVYDEKWATQVRRG